MAELDPKDLLRIAAENGLEFTSYTSYSPESDSLTIYFKPDPDYSKKVSDEMTLYLSLDNDEIVGCRIEGISDLIEGDK